MANRPIDDFDPRNADGTPPTDAPMHDEHEPIDDEADFGGSHTQSQGRRMQAGHDNDLHDDADFVDDDMNDIVDDADPLAGDDHYDDQDDSDNDHDNLGDEDSDGDDDAPAQAPSRFSLGSLIFYIIIAGVIAGGGFMAYRTFMGGGEPVSPGTLLQAASNAASEVKGVVVPTDANIPTPAPVPADNSNPVPNTNPAPTPVAANNNWQTTLPEETINPSQQAQMQPVVQPAPAAPAGTVPVTPSGAAAAPLAATVANTEAMAGLNARLAETESQLARMTATVTTLTQNLQASQTEVATLKQRPAQAAAITAPPAISASELAALRTENASLQKKIDQLTQSLQTQLQTASSRAATTATAPVTVAEKPPVIAASPKTAAPKKTISADNNDAMMDDSPRSPKTRPQTAATKSSWVLRAATPGMAWVSPQPGSAELKRVVPGDQLPGIGQVTAIRQENGRWIVEGSNGTIR